MQTITEEQLTKGRGKINLSFLAFIQQNSNRTRAAKAPLMKGHDGQQL